MSLDPDLDWIDGQPFSRRYGDVYFSRASGLEECAHVFIRGNDLDARFAALAPGESFAVGEIGFGTGLNFLSAWQHFLARAPATSRLHFVSTERHPLSRADLERALALWPAVAREAAGLLAQWDVLPPAFHRFVFEDGRVMLTLLVGDARETLPRLDGVVDAWFLDGFSPARNPELWSAELFDAVSRRSRVGTTCATYSVAGVVRRTLEASGFRVERRPGFGPKREMLAAVCVEPRPDGYRAPWLVRAMRHAPRSAAVIGGGLAGTAAAASLAARGLPVTLIERHPTLAAEASGNPQGVLYVKPSAHGTPLTGLMLSGLAFSLRELARRLPDHGDVWSRCGVLALAQDADERARQQSLADLGWPPVFLRHVDAVEASRLAGVALDHGGLFYPRSGWVHPAALCAAFAAGAGIQVRLATDALSLVQTGDGGWGVHGAHGEVIAAADVVVVAGARDTLAFPQLTHLPLRPIRGQITVLAATGDSARLRTVLCGESYVTPARAGRHCAGATFTIGDAAVDERVEDHAANLAQLAGLAPSLAEGLRLAQLDPARLTGRAAVRVVTPDYLPIVGPAADAPVFAARFDRLRHDATTRFDAAAPWLDGLYVSVGHGSRGLVTAPVAAELIADLATAAPLTLPRDVAEVLSPSRFLARSLKRHGTPSQAPVRRPG